jgi:hypothetical protein
MESASERGRPPRTRQNQINDNIYTMVTKPELQAAKEDDLE